MKRELKKHQRGLKVAIPQNREKDFPSDRLIVSKTDTSGRITYGNSLFIELSGYDEQELLGQPHNIIRHPDMPKVVFKLLWDTLAKGNEIFAYVKNLSKDGGYYWVLANVTPSFDLSGRVIGYHSVRRRPKKEAIAVIEPLYRKLNDLERSGGVSASQKAVEQLLSEKGVNYEKFILSL